METREDLHRITVGNVQDWQTLCCNYKLATHASLQSHILAHGLNHEIDALLAHIDQVRLDSNHDARLRPYLSSLLREHF